MIPAPKTITIGGKTYKVRQNPHLCLLENAHGICLQSDLIIEVDEGLGPEMKTSTFLHEAVEAINKVWLANRLEHDDIDRLGEALLQLLNGLGVEIDWTC